MIGIRRLASLGVFIVTLVLYLATLAPTLTTAHFGADGGDFVSAVVTQGVPHPPGYPTYLVLGSLFAHLPISNIAFRLNLFSALCMALTAALTTWSVTTIPSPAPVDAASLKTSTGTGSVVGVLAGLAFSVAPLVWGQATIAEVHALNALFVAIILALLTPIIFRAETVSTSRLALAFFAWGLGLGNQLTLLALLPLFISVLLGSRTTHHASRFTFHSSVFTLHSSRLTRYSVLILAFLFGLAVYLLIPLRAAAQPPVNWLGEVTPQNVINFFTAEIYRGYAFAVPLAGMPARLIALAQTSVAQFGWLGVLMGAVGLWQMIINTQRGLGAVILSAMLYLIFALGYNTPDSDLYLIPIWLFGACAIAAGAYTLLNRAPTVLRLPAFALLLLLIPGLNILNSYASLDLHTDRNTEVFAQQVWAQLPSDAVLITHIDAQTFTLWYYRLVEGQRSDVAVIDARLAAYEWAGPMLRAQVNLVAYDPEETWLDRLRAANSTRPICELDVTTTKIRCP